MSWDFEIDGFDPDLVDVVEHKSSALFGTKAYEFELRYGNMYDELHDWLDSFPGPQQAPSVHHETVQDLQPTQHASELGSQIYPPGHEPKIAEYDYRMNHRAPGPESAAIHDIDAVHQHAPDIYTHPEYYMHSNDGTYQQSWKALHSVQNQPDKSVRLYRAGPTTQFNPGDWVTPSLEYAKSQAAIDDDPFNDMPVHSVNVPASMIHWDGNDLNEMGYNGPVVAGTTVIDPAAQYDRQPVFAANEGSNDELHIALEIPDDIKDEIKEWVDKQDWPDGTELEDKNDYHITLLYSGEGYDEHHDAEWFNHTSGYEVSVEDLVEFPEQDGTHPIVLRISSPEVKIHANDLLDQAENRNLPINRFPGGYKPHLTLAYGPRKPSYARAPKLTFITGPSKVSKPRIDKTASDDVIERLQDASAQITHVGDYGELYWNPDERKVHWIAGDADGYGKTTDPTEIVKILNVSGVDSVEVGDESAAPEGYIKLKNKARVLRESAWEGWDDQPVQVSS